MTRWQFWDLAHWDPACAIFVFEYVVKPRLLGISEPDLAAIAKGTEMFHRVATVLDGQLKGKKFALGDELTLVDFSLGAAMNLAQVSHFPIDPYDEIKRWHTSLLALPAWQKTLSQSVLPTVAAA